MNRQMGAELVRIAGTEHVKVVLSQNRAREEFGDVVERMHEMTGHVSVTLPFIPDPGDHTEKPKEIRLSGQKEATVKNLRLLIERLAPLEQEDHRQSEGGFHVYTQKSRHHGTRAGKTIDLKHYVISHQNPNSEEWREFVRGIIVEKLSPTAQSKPTSST